MEFVLAGVGGIVGAFLTGIGFLLYIAFFKPQDKLEKKVDTLEKKLIADEKLIQANENQIKHQEESTTRIENSINGAMTEIKSLFKKTLSENDVKDISGGVGEKHKTACHAEVKNMIYKALSEHEKNKHK